MQIWGKLIIGYRKGNKYLNEKSYKEALFYFNRVVKEDPNNSTALHQRGVVLYEMGQLKEALDNFRGVLEIDPDFVSAYQWQASVFQKLGRLQEANLSLQRADKISVEWQTGAQSLWSSGNYQRAILYCDMLLYHNTLVGWAWNMKGLCLYNAGSYDEALSCYDQSIKSGFANDYIVLFNKAECLLALQRNKEAIDWYEKALQIKPDYVRALQSKANALKAIGNQIEADSVRKKLRGIQRKEQWDSLKDKLRKYTLQTTIAALLLGCICLLISFLARPSWIMKAGITAILLAVCGGVFWLNLRLTWLPVVLAFGITAFITILWSSLRWDERKAEQAKKDMRKKEIHLNKEVERVTNVIREKIARNTPIENILPNIRIEDYETLAKAISTIGFFKDIDKGCLFKNMHPDFISKVLTYFSEDEEITILRQIEQKKREEVLMRYALHSSKRQRLVLCQA
jgi:tetratricopeptide (TPR) repeat protein